MIKPLAIAASGGLHVTVFVAMLAAGVGDLPEGRNSAVRLVVAVPVATMDAVSQAIATAPTSTGWSRSFLRLKGDDDGTTGLFTMGSVKFAPGV